MFGSNLMSNRLDKVDKAFFTPLRKFFVKTEVILILYPFIHLRANALRNALFRNTGLELMYSSFRENFL